MAKYKKSLNDRLSRARDCRTSLTVILFLFLFVTLLVTIITYINLESKVNELKIGGQYIDVSTFLWVPIIICMFAFILLFAFHRMITLMIDSIIVMRNKIYDVDVSTDLDTTTESERKELRYEMKKIAQKKHMEEIRIEKEKEQKRLEEIARMRLKREEERERKKEEIARMQLEKEKERKRLKEERERMRIEEEKARMEEVSIEKDQRELDLAKLAWEAEQRRQEKRAKKE